MILFAELILKKISAEFSHNKIAQRKWKLYPRFFFLIKWLVFIFAHFQLPFYMGFCLWYGRVCIISYSECFSTVAFCKQAYKYYRQFSLSKASSSSPNSKTTFRFNFYCIMIYCIYLDDNEKSDGFHKCCIWDRTI